MENPIVALHGFLGSSDDWKLGFPVRALDLPSVDALPSWSVASLANWFLENSLPNEIPVGYSMGGRILIETLRHRTPPGLILISAAPGLRESVETRLKQDENWARRFEAHDPTVLKDWYSQPLFSGLLDDPQFSEVLTRRKNFDGEKMARLLREASPARRGSAQEMISRLKIPILYIVGEKDTKYLGWATEIVDWNPQIEVEVIPNAGHALILTHGPELSRIIQRWKARHFRKI